MKRLKKSWCEPSKAVVQLILAAVMVVALLATAVPGVGAVAQDDTGSIAEDQGAASVDVLDSDSSGTILDIHVQDVEEEAIEVNDETFQVLTISGYAYTSEVGKPQIPVIRETIGIPDGASVQATVLDASYATYTGYNVYPVQPPEVDSEGGGEFTIDEQFYSQDALYPEQIVEVEAPAIWRDLSVVGLQVNPVQFNPASGELRVYDHIRVQLEYSGGEAVSKTIEPKYARMYQSVILNYDYLGIVEGYLASEDIAQAEVTLPSQDGFELDGTPVDTSIKLLSLRPRTTIPWPDVKPFLDWHKKRGLPYVSYGVLEPMTANDVKSLINSVYTSHPELEYVLLVGDIDLIPWQTAWGSDPGDYWYACLTGGATPDIYPEVAVGRLTVNNVTELQQQTTKIITYSDSPPAGDWLDKALLVAHKELAPGKYQGCKEDIRTATYGDPFTFDTAYGAAAAQGGDDATNADVKSAIDAGRGIVNYRGHGSPGDPSPRPWGVYWGSNWNTSNEEFWTTNAHALSNGDKTPVVFSISCLNASLDNTAECLGEAFIKDDDSAVAFLGAARPSYTTPNHEFDKDIFDAIGNEGIYNIGLVLNDANVELINRYGASSPYTDNCKMYLWLGDPALELWTAAPRALDVDYPATVSTAMTVTVKDDITKNPLANALVCLTKGDPIAPDVYTYKYTNASGQAAFTFSTSYDGPMTVTVTRHNYLPHQGTTQVDTSAPSVTVTSPNGGEIWSVGSTHEIAWTATDSLDVVTTIDLYYSVDGGSTYPYTIATDEADDGAYPWTIPNTASTECRVKVVAHDDAGYTAEDVSDANFTISKPNIWVEPPSFDVTLPPDTTWSGNLRIGDQGQETLTYNIRDVETTGGPCFKWVAQDPDPLPAYYAGILKAEVHDPDGLADIDTVKIWVTQRPSDWGYMRDDGTLGDEIAGDGIYTSGIYGTTYYGEEIGMTLQAEDLAGNTGHTSHTVHIEIGDATVGEGTKGLLNPAAETRYTGTVEPSEGAQVQGNTSDERTETVEVTPSYDVDALATVALFEDSSPWGYTAIEDLLIAHGIPYDIYNSSDMGTVDLSGYDKVITASVQGDAFWDALEANKAWFESYVNAGGVLEMHLCAHSISNSPGKVYPGGFVFSYEGLEYVSILAPTHPVVNIPNVVTDAELDGWSYSTHGWFSAIPPGGDVVLTATANGKPVWAEAEFGSGYIFATTQTVEWRAGHGYPEFLENMILHMPMPDCPWLDEDPTFGSVAPEAYDDIAVTIDTTGLGVGEYSAEIYVTNNDPNKNLIIVPVQLRVKAAIDVGSVLFDETHSPQGGYFTIENYYSDWAALLTSWGFTVDSATTGPITYELLKDYCAVVIPEPTEPYTTAEVEAIAEYVNEGGGLLILGEYGYYAQSSGIFPVVNELAAPFGMSFNDDTVYDDAHNDGGTNFWPLIPDFDAAVAGADVGQVVEYAGCSIGTEGAAFPIAWTYGGAYTDMAALADLLLDGSGAGIAAGEVSAPAADKSAQTQNYAGEGIDTITGEVAGQSVGVQLTPMADTDAGGKVLWDLTHGVYLGYEPSGYFSSLVAMLTEKGYTIETTAAGILTVDLSQYAVLVVSLGSAWDSAYTTAEVTAIINFVEGGGGLLVMGDNTDCPNYNINPVSQEFGTTCGISDAGNVITDLEAHPIFDGVSQLEMPVPGEIDGSVSPSEEVAWDDAAKAVVSVATGSGRVVITGEVATWVNDCISLANNQLFAENVFDWLSAPPGPVPVMAASLFGDGRAMVIGDGSLFNNHDPDGDGFMCLYEYDNEKLAVNIIDWLCQPAPSLDVQKQVWDRCSEQWVEETCAPLEGTVRFRCEIHNDGTSCDLTEILVHDVLSESLEYADNATVNGEPWEPTQVGPNTYEWDLAPWVLKPSERITIEFEAVVVTWSPTPDINLQQVHAWCEQMETEVSNQDEAAVQPFIPGDANMDGIVDVFDLVAVKRIILGLEGPTCGADANQDCVIDVFDLVKIKRIILGLE